mgnify:CR=1 FL=1
MPYPHREESNVSRIVRSIRELWEGRSNAVGEFTLAANAAATVVSADNCGENSRIALTPRTANAAGALATTYITAANVVPGQFTVTHANNAQADKTFGYSLSG